MGQLDGQCQELIDALSQNGAAEVSLDGDQVLAAQSMGGEVLVVLSKTGARHRGKFVREVLSRRWRAPIEYAEIMLGGDGNVIYAMYRTHLEGLSAESCSQTVNKMMDLLRL